jgi:hypothetical protein
MPILTLERCLRPSSILHDGDDDEDCDQTNWRGLNRVFTPRGDAQVSRITPRLRRHAVAKRSRRLRGGCPLRHPAVRSGSHRCQIPSR